MFDHHDRRMQIVVRAEKDFLDRIRVQYRDTVIEVTVPDTPEFPNVTPMVLAHDNRWYPQERGPIVIAVENEQTYRIHFGKCVFGYRKSYGAYHVVAVAAKIDTRLDKLPDGVPHSKLVTVHRRK